MKPPYRVPSMGEIRAIPWNGINVASTFSGCGGSSLGYRMAGCRVVWANEFIPLARESYAANSDAYLNGKDIRTISVEEIKRQAGVEIDILDGSPPCSSFSTAGSRQGGWGKKKKYSDTTQRTDDLFYEFARILSGLQPKAFIAENVRGLVIGVAKGYFKNILAALRRAGYRVAVKVLDASSLGVPQRRRRVIFSGVRNDLGIAPAHPKPLPYMYCMRDAFVDVPKVPDDEVPWLRTPAICRDWDNLKIGSRLRDLSKEPLSMPAGTLTATAGDITARSIHHPHQRRKFTVPELKRICSFPDDFILIGDYAKQVERLGRSVPPVMMRQISASVVDSLRGGK